METKHSALSGQRDASRHADGGRIRGIRPLRRRREVMLFWLVLLLVTICQTAGVSYHIKITTYFVGGKNIKIRNSTG